MSGCVSRLGFKSDDQGREAFQGTEKDLIWLDEEANEGIRSECVIRLMTTGGLLIETFTPLRGLTPIVLKYLGDDAEVPQSRVSENGDRAIVMAGWVVCWRRRAGRLGARVTLRVAGFDRQHARQRSDWTRFASGGA